MSVFTSRPGLRWIVPTAVLAVVLGAGGATRLIAASAAESLPSRSAAQLLVDLQTATVAPMSGTVVQKADLGFPKLPTGGGEGSSDLTSLISGNHTLRVWYDGPERARVALLGTLGESDVVRNGHDLWIWSSQQNAASHRRLSDQEKDRPGVPAEASELPMTPQQAAQYALDAISPTTKVSTAGTARVAGRSAYELVLAPKDADSLIGQVRLAIDGERHIPLRVQVYPKSGDSVAVEVAFTRISFSRPDAGQFRFTPPKGAKVTEATDEPEANHGPDRMLPAGRPTAIGEGWTTVLVLRGNKQDPTASPGPADGNRPEGGNRPDGDDPAAGLGAIVSALPQVSGDWGSGRLLKSRLFSVLLIDDGRVLVGAVSPERLYAAAADPRAALNAPASQPHTGTRGPK